MEQVTSPVSMTPTPSLPRSGMRVHQVLVELVEQLERDAQVLMVLQIFTVSRLPPYGQQRALL